jgi:hypothetical protein
MKRSNRKRIRPQILIRVAVEDLVERNRCLVLVPETDFEPVLFYLYMRDPETYNDIFHDETHIYL